VMTPAMRRGLHRSGREGSVGGRTQPDTGRQDRRWQTRWG
jgi:hypothetical protein